MTAPHDVCDPHGGCITCGDVAVEMRVVAVDAEAGLATCRDEAGQVEQVDVLLVDPVRPGDRVLVHAGTAIAGGGAA